MPQFTKTFYDIEHEGDEREINDAIYNNGGKIISRSYNYEAEQLELTIEVPDIAKFREAVKGDYYFS